MKKIIPIFAFLLIIIPNLGFSSECINWSKVMTSNYMQKHKSDHKIILINSLENYTKKRSDEWLSQALPELISSFLFTDKNLFILSGVRASYIPKELKTDYELSGMFQKFEGSLRVFIKLVNSKDKKTLAQYQTVSPFPDNKDFFVHIKDLAIKISKDINAKPDFTAMDNIANLTSSTKAFENYSKGLQALQKYKLNELEVAEIWFAQAKKADYQYFLAYQGMIDLLIFKGMYYKQQNKAFGSYFEEVEQEIKKQKQFSKIQEQTYSHNNSDRFLAGHAEFIKALIAAQAENFKRAAEALEKAVNFVPEDAISWYELSKIYAKLGKDKKAVESMQKATTINTCINNGI